MDVAVTFEEGMFGDEDYFAITLLSGTYEQITLTREEAEYVCARLRNLLHPRAGISQVDGG